MRIKLWAAIFAAVTALTMCLTVNAAELESGSVVGFPERIAVLDDDGGSVSDNGEYFFEVDNMQPGKTYTKKIQIMNLFEDKAFRVYFKAESVSKKGEIDLEKECTCTITLDGEQIYQGSVTGEGTPNINEKAIDLGLYEPGSSSHLVVNIVWNGTNAGGHIDNGTTIVTTSGTETVREPSGNTHISGEIQFKWIFSAFLEEETSGSSEVSKPHSDIINTGEAATVIILILVTVASIFLVFLLFNKKRRNNRS